MAAVVLENIKKVEFHQNILESVFKPLGLLCVHLVSQLLCLLYERARMRTYFPLILCLLEMIYLQRQRTVSNESTDLNKALFSVGK